MSILHINTGTSANKGDGDTIRLAFHKVNLNFSEVVKLTEINTFTSLTVTTTGTFNDITATNITVLNTATINNLTVGGTFNVGQLQGFDDFNIIKNDASGLFFRIRNTDNESFSAIQLLDGFSGGLTIRHQNLLSASPSFESGQHYIYGNTPFNVLNIGRWANLNFYANAALYTNPLAPNVPSITIQASDGRVIVNKDINIDGDIIPQADALYDLGSPFLQWRRLYVSTSTIYIGGVPVAVAGNTLTVNGIEVVTTQTSGGVGYTGSAGSTGYTGSAGITGYTGSQGEQGIIGYTGSAGSGSFDSTSTLVNGTYTLSLASTGPVNIPTASTGLGRLQNVDGIEILVNSGGSAKLFTFANNGNLTFPDATVQSTAYTGLQTSLVGAVDNNVLIRTSETIVTNNLYNNTTDFVTDIDPGLGYPIGGWSQRNETEIEVNLFVPGLGSFYTFLTGLALGRTVVVTYSTAGGNQTFTSTVSQIFSGIAQFDPVTGWQRTSGRILGTLPVGQTGIVSINFPVTTTPQHDWTFSDTGSLTFPDGTTQTTAYISGGGVGGTTSTLVAGTATLSISTLSETVLPSGLKFEPIENYGFGFGGTIAMQTYGEQLQMLATGTGAFGLFGYGEVIGGPGGVAYLVGNQDGTNEVKIVAGSYTATVNTWEFKNNGDLIVPNAILGSGDQALVIQNTASGVAYLQLPVDPSADSVILANQAASSATVTIRVGDFGSEKDWTFDEFGALATPGIIYNTDTSNVGQLLLAGAPGEPATYLALPSDVGSTSMNVRLVNSNGNIQLTAGNNTWLYNDSGELTLPNGSMLFESSLIAASGTNAVLSQFDSNTQVYTMDYAVGVQTHNSGTYHTWLFNNTGDLELPGGSVLATSGYDVALIAGNDGTSTFGTVTISTQYPPDLTDRNWEFNSLGEFYLPLGGAIQETVVTNEIWGTTTTSLTLVPAGAANGTQRLEIYSTGAGEGDHIHITSGDQSQTDLFLGNDTQYFSVGAMGQMEVRARPGTASPAPGTGAYAGSPVWIYAGDAGDNGGNTADGASGGDILLQAGISTANAVGGSVYLQSASGPAGFGSIKLSTDNGSTYLEFDKDDNLTFPSGGDIVFDSSATSYIYGVTGIEFADATTQTTAFTGTSALLDITNTNGIDTTYYLTFVENRTAGQEVRADVDLTFNSWSNTLGVGKVSVNSTAGSTSTTTGALTVAGGVGIQGDLWAGNIYSNGVQLTAGGGGGGGGVTSLTAGTGTFVSSTSGAVTIWVGNTSNLEETFESKTTATGVVVHDCTTNRLFYHTGATGNITPNFTNLGLAAGEATSISLVIVQGGTARNVSGVQIAGTTTGVTLVWQGSASAPSGNANRTDVFSFSILCTATNAYTVLGMLTSFGGI